MASDLATLVMPHVPKTAGTGLRTALAAYFGDRLLLDYADVPLQRSVTVRRLAAAGAALRWGGHRSPYACIFGHFLPLKYLGLRQARFGIWIRDPVQRVVSRYHHYLRACAAGETAHARWGLVPGLSLEAFVELPQYRNTYSEYLWGFPLARFSFVGRVECMTEDLDRFRRSFGVELEMPTQRVNGNPERSDGGYPIDPGLEARIRQLNSRDLRLLERLTRGVGH